MIIGITGTLAAGKGTVVEFLKKRGFGHYSVREFLVEEMKLRGMPINRDSMVIMANYLREKNSPGYIAEKMYEKASKKGGDFVIESIRSVGEVETLRKHKDFYLFGVDAAIETRYERAVGRGNETDHVSFAKFVSDEEKEFENYDPTKGNLRRCLELADFRFENNGTVEELYAEVDKALDSIRRKPDESSGRKDYISWDDYFMGVAVLSSMRSKDPSTQVGACIVDPDKKIVGTGYNGAPRGIDDNSFPWAREGDFLETKYAYVCHAELNAILNSTRENLNGCTLYVALFPCNECAKAIIQSGIKKVVYLSDKYKDTPANLAAKRMFTETGIELVKLKPKSENLKLNFEI